MSARIRAVTLGDVALLARLHGECFDDPWDGPAFLRLLERSKTFALLCGEAETYSQAFILVQVAADEAEILSLGTAPSARRKGFAQALVHASADEAARLGAIAMFLEVAEDNLAAIALYARIGFAVCGRRTHYYQRREERAVDAVLLRTGLAL
jgi:ribosomal-protein-alanine N-acetyltransferase